MAESADNKPSPRLTCIVALLEAANLLGLLLSVSWFCGAFVGHPESRGMSDVMGRELGMLMGLALLVPSLTVLIINWRKLRWGSRLLLLPPVVMIALSAALHLL